MLSSGGGKDGKAARDDENCLGGIDPIQSTPTSNDNGTQKVVNKEREPKKLKKGMCNCIELFTIIST
jgi:hypothetical protein